MLRAAQISHLVHRQSCDDDSVARLITSQGNNIKEPTTGHGGDGSRRRFAREDVAESARCQRLTPQKCQTKKALAGTSNMATRPARRRRAQLPRSAETRSLRLAEFVEGDDRYRRHRRAIIRLQNQLRALVSDEAWGTYLRLEEESAARLAVATELAAKWDYKQSRRR